MNCKFIIKKLVDIIILFMGIYYLNRINFSFIEVVVLSTIVFSVLFINWLILGRG